MNVVDMIRQIRMYGIRDERIISAMRNVRRECFIGDSLGACNAYGDYPLPIGCGQTVSQPFIVAYMTGLLDVQAGCSVLEIGSGSGYQAAVLADMGVNVYTVERIAALAERAESVCSSEGYNNILFKQGDGYKGWPDHAPYDGIILTCAPPSVPEILFDQLKTGCRLVAPVGVAQQYIICVTKTKDGLKTERGLDVRFVPMLHGTE